MSSLGWRVRTQVRSALSGRATALAGLVAGTCAFLVGFAITYLLEGLRVRSPTRPLVEFIWFGIDSGVELNVGPTGPLPGAHQFTAWQYMTLHGVGFERYIQDELTLAPPEMRLLVFIPALLLLGAGAFVVRQRGSVDPWTASARGGAVALGYLPLVVLAALGSQWMAPDGVAFEYFGLTSADPVPVGTIGVSQRQAVLIAGLAYPVLFGAVGGYLAFLWSGRPWPTKELAPGVVAGAIAFLVGWGLTVRQSVARARQEDFWRARVLQGGPGEEASVALDPGAFQVGTWQFHRLHGGSVETRYVGPVTDGIDPVSLPVMSQGPGGFYPPSVLIVLLLVVAGAIVADRADTHGPWRAGVRGATVVLGYLPLSLATAFVVTSKTTGTIQAVIGVQLVDAFLLTGIALPLFIGAIGGVLAYLTMT